MPVNSEATVELICDVCGNTLNLIDARPLSELPAASERAARAGWTFDALMGEITCEVCTVREGKDLTIDATRDGFQLAVSLQGKDWSSK